ncbi:MAG: transposase [Pyrinomonadaceae bacterium]
MARRARVEVEGGLYHLITRGNDRQDIFHSPDDYLKFLSLLLKQKERSAFYLYAYCLMTNLVHLLIERQLDTVGSIMQRVLTGYSQYYNRRYRRVGHVFQGRHKAILCQSGGYLTKLVRYIHLNPVRAKMVVSAEDYPYSSHRAYLGIEPSGIVDVDPVLRHFGSRKEIAYKYFADYVGTVLPDDEEAYSTAEGDILGSDEFVDDAIHRFGIVERKPQRRSRKDEPAFDAESLISAVEDVFGMSGKDLFGSGKNTRVIMAKEVLIITGREAGASFTQLAEITGLDSSNVSRRYDAAKLGLDTDTKLAYAKTLMEQKYREKIAESQA